MSRLGDRLRKLEDAEPERCGNCRDWPDPRLVFEGEETDDLPARCPRCGYEPLTIEIVFTEEAGRL